MRWEDLRRSTNIEHGGRGGGFGLPIGGRGLGGVGLVVVVIASLFFGFDPTVLIQGLPPGGPIDGRPRQTDPRAQDFVSAVLGSTEDTWTALFRQSGQRYQEPHLVLFEGAVQSECGVGQSAMGPFYCPLDQKVYLDLTFFDDLRRRFGAPGDFAQAYVIAHEVGHHVQTLLGISNRVHEAQSRNPAQRNALSVRQELQADCFAGMWAHHAERARQILEQGDLEEALAAATAIGDDRLQRQSQGRVTPDSFTHGSSEQRVRWFRRGLEQGTLDACDTFNARTL